MTCKLCCALLAFFYPVPAHAISGESVGAFIASLGAPSDTSPDNYSHVEAPDDD